MTKTQSSVKEFAIIGFLLLAVLFGMQIMTFVFGNLGAVDQLDDDTVRVNNESIDLVDATGIGTITDTGNTNFVSWNATRIINVTLVLDGAGAGSNETLIEGDDYTVFSGNGTFGNLTWFNSTIVTYDHVRKTEAEVIGDEVVNQSLRAIGDYSDQSGTQFTTLAIAITLVILVAVFLFFWIAFMGKGKEQGPGGFS